MVSLMNMIKTRLTDPVERVLSYLYHIKEREALHGRLNTGTSDNDADEDNQQHGDDGIGCDLERPTGHCAVLMQSGMHRVVMGHRAQLVLDLA